jgi:GNAT superfamily N-acetyltransferase
MSDPQPALRRAHANDGAEMARLSAQLGYPMSVVEMAGRVKALATDERHYVAVAAVGERLLGFMHVEHRFSLEGGDRAELMGLVVDPSARRLGLGRTLVQAAEDWARERGLAALTVRSNAARELSHPFYEALGYSREKTQHVYRKSIR